MELGKVTLFLFVFLFCFSLASAAQPSVSVITPSVGCIMKFPEYDFIKVGRDFDFNFHIYNVTDGVPVGNQSLRCSFHLYNQSDDHVFWNQPIADPVTEHNVNNEWKIPISGNNFSTPGEYTYVFQCNQTNFGCAVSGQVTATPLGIELTTGRSVIFTILVITAIGIFLGLLIAGFLIDGKNKRDEMTGYIIALNNLKYVRILCFAFAYVAMIVIFYLLYTIFYAFLYMDFVVQLFKVFFSISAWGLVIVFPVAIYLLIANAVRDSGLADSLAQGLRIR